METASIVKAAAGIGYPVILRPSYVLGGRAMRIVYDEESLRSFLDELHSVSRGHPVLIDKFLEDAGLSKRLIQDKDLKTVKVWSRICYLK